jgi:hypothetical protein
MTALGEGEAVGVGVGVGVGVVPPPGDCGVTGFDAGLAADVPIRLVAVEVNVYVVPLVSPEMVHEPLVPVIGQVSDPGVEVTTHDAAGPPICGLTVTVACPLPAVTVGAAGVVGAVKHGAVNSS